MEGIPITFKASFTSWYKLYHMLSMAERHEFSVSNDRLYINVYSGEMTLYAFDLPVLPIDKVL